jgi:hypothetical protein
MGTQFGAEFRRKSIQLGIREMGEDQLSDQFR